MSNHQHPYGKSENVLGFTEDGKVFIHDAPLKEMFLHPEVKHRKIVAFSIIGAYRKGKSFFLDYCLRYMYAHYPSIRFPNNSVSNPDDWLGDENEPLVGFSWMSGIARVTTGIDIWNDVFLHTDGKTGEQIGIILIDTHGLFDNVTSALDNSRIFTLGTLLSSIQVLNLSGVIQDDQLQYIQFATECAKFTCAAGNDTSVKCFQNLIFLIRDWDNPDEFEYGIEGGIKYFDRFQNAMTTHKKDLQYICESIYSSFDNIICSLLPHPGKFVSRGKSGSKEYDGSWKEMDEEFQEELTKLIAYILNSKQLAIKKVNDSELIGEEFLNFMENQLKTFQTDEALQAQTVYDSTIKKEMEKLVNSCVEHYKDLGNRGKNTVNSEEDLELLHRKCKEEALATYDGTKKLGGPEDFTKFRILLEKRIEKTYLEVKIQIEKEQKALEEAKEKLRLEMEEKQKIEVERMEKEKKVAEERLKAEKQKAKEKLEFEEKLRQQEIAELNRQAELAQKVIDDEKEKARLEKEEEIKRIEKEVEVSQIEAEKKMKEKFEKEKREQEIKENLEKIEKLKKETENKVPLEHYESQSPKLEKNKPKDELQSKTSSHTSKKEIDKHENHDIPQNNSSKVEFKEPNQFSSARNSEKIKSQTASSSNLINQPSLSISVPHESLANYRAQVPTPSSTVIDYQHPPQNTQEWSKIKAKPTNESTARQEIKQFGEPKRVINFQSSLYDSHELAKIFEHQNVRDRKIAVLAVSGNNKEERGHFLDLCLKYLYAHYASIKHHKIQYQNLNQWYSFENKLDAGFVEYHRKHHEVTGIVIWNDVFLESHDIAIVVMDVHGIFEHEKSTENSKLFTFSSLISSVQVLNLSLSDPRECMKDFKYVKDFKQFPAQSTTGVPQKWFQNIEFLLNDQKQKSTINFDEFLSVGIMSGKDIKNVRELIQNSFENYNCVLRSANPQQQQHNLIILVERLLASSRITLKTVNRECVTSSDYFEYLQLYFECFKNYGLPSPQEVYRTIAGKQIVDLSYNHYIEYVLRSIGTISNHQALHNLSKEDTLGYFGSLCSERGINIDHDPYEAKLKKKIDYIFEQYQRKSPESFEIIENECKKVMSYTTQNMPLLPVRESDYQVVETSDYYNVGRPSLNANYEVSSSEARFECKIS